MLELLAKPPIATEVTKRLGVAAPLALRRAWPRSPDTLLLEYLDCSGRIVPAQWFRSPAEEPGLLSAAGGEIMLQPAGTDHQLPGLSSVVERRHTSLVSHRPGQRAVVRHDDGVSVRFAKITRPSRIGRQLDPLMYLTELPGRPFGLPEVLEVDEGRGVVWSSALAGRSLHDRLAEPGLQAHAGSLGRSLRWLHQAPPPANAARHDAGAEIDLITAQLGLLEIFAPTVARRVKGFAPAICDRLSKNAQGDALLHRDLHDKQIFVEPCGSIALLDFDTLATGEPALDVANMLAHFELRAIQRCCSKSGAARAADAFMIAYDPGNGVRQRIPAYLDAARLRLACLYAYRPRWPEVPDALIARLGS